MLKFIDFFSQLFFPRLSGNSLITVLTEILTSISCLQEGKTCLVNHRIILHISRFRSFFRWPWMTLVGYKNKLGEVSFKCGGSIISNRHVLTGLLNVAN